MHKLYLIILISFFCNALLHAEIVKKVEIFGNKRVSNETVKIYGGVKINQDVSEKKINQILTDLYATNFFEDVKIELSNGILKINLIEYPVINELIILGEPAKKYLSEIKI